MHCHRQASTISLRHVDMTHGYTSLDGSDSLRLAVSHVHVCDVVTGSRVIAKEIQLR